jgi:hypothetical protein
MPLRCVECGARSDEGYLWRAFILEGGGRDESTEVLCYCPICAERELGQGTPRAENGAAKAQGGNGPDGAA